MNDSDLKTMLAEAESHYSRYEWDAAIARFEAVLAEHANHGAAAQGLAGAIQQKAVEAELAATIAEARAALDAHQFTGALAALNRAQTRAAMRHILKYHAEIDGLRTQAQERLEWQRRVERALAEARRLTAEKQLDAALHVLDTIWHELIGRGLEALGQTLRREYDRLSAERDLAQRIDAAEWAFARQDYRQAYELAGSLSQQHPAREDLVRMHERFGLVWNSFQSRLAGVHEALAEDRLDDAVAVLASLRHDWPDNPDWRALWLRVHVDYGRAQVEAGRGAMGEHRFDQAASAFAGARGALAAALDVFEGHPTAGLARDEAEALQGAATAAAQATRDGAAGRWDAAWRDWQAAGEKLRQAVRVRGRDFGEVAIVIEGLLGDAGATVAALDQARLLLAEGQGALVEGDAGRARECFREGLSRARRGGDDLREPLQAGLRAAGDAQREARALLGRAERTDDAVQRLALLRRAYVRWRTAPGLADRLAGRLLEAARRALANGDEKSAAGYCEQALSLTEARGEQLTEAAQLARRSAERRQARAAVAEAARTLTELRRQDQPSAAAYRRVLEILAAAPWQEMPELQGMAAELERLAQERYERLAAAEPHLVRAEALRQAGDWGGAVAALEHAVAALEDEAGAAAGSSPLARRLAAWRAVVAGLERALGEAGEALTEAQELYGAGAAGGLAAVDWARLAGALERATARLAAPPPGANPLPRVWTDQVVRRDDLAGRAALLREVYAQVEAGRAVEALPALVQAVAGWGRDPVLSAVLQRLQDETDDEAGARAEALAAEAREAVARGEMDRARQWLGEARLYASANPRAMGAIIETLERQVTALERMAQCALAQGLSVPVAAEPDAALSAYRAALELAVGEDGGFPAAVRQDLNLLLGLEDALWNGEVAREGEALFRRLVEAAANDLLVRNHLLAPLRRWWKLALRAAAADFITARLLVGDPAAAYARAREAFAAAPRDAELRDLFVRARQEWWARRQADLGRRVARARRLAERGAYAEALAELAPHQGDFPVSDVALLALGVGADQATDEALPEGLAAALAEAGELRLDLVEASELAGRLAPVAERVRTALAEGRLDPAAEALEEAGLVDPGRRCTMLWRELEAIAALAEARRGRAERARLDELAGRAEAALELCGSAGEALAILEQVTAAGTDAARLVGLAGLAGPEAERLRDRLAALKAGAAAGWERLERMEAALNSARQAGEVGAVTLQMAALKRGAVLANGRALEAIQAEIARLQAELQGQTGKDQHNQWMDAAPAAPERSDERAAVSPPPETNGKSSADGGQSTVQMVGQSTAATVDGASASLPDGGLHDGSPGDGSPGDGSPDGGAEGAPELARADAGDGPVVEAAVEVEMLATFDFDDWLSNVTPVAPEEDDDGSRRGMAGGTR